VMEGEGGSHGTGLGHGPTICLPKYFVFLAVNRQQDSIFVRKADQIGHIFTKSLSKCRFTLILDYRNLHFRSHCRFTTAFGHNAIMPATVIIVMTDNQIPQFRATTCTNTLTDS
jgi:hypothetical protein